MEDPGLLEEAGLMEEDIKVALARTLLAQAYTKLRGIRAVEKDAVGALAFGNQPSVGSCSRPTKYKTITGVEYIAAGRTYQDASFDMVDIRKAEVGTINRQNFVSPFAISSRNLGPLSPLPLTPIFLLILSHLIELLLTCHLS